MKKATQPSKVKVAYAMSTAQGKFSAKSSITEAQRQRILASLGRAPKTSHQLRCEGIYQVSARIKELREMGYRIHTHRVNLVDRDGFWHPRCALYSLTESGVQ